MGTLTAEKRGFVHFVGNRQHPAQQVDWLQVSPYIPDSLSASLQCFRPVLNAGEEHMCFTVRTDPDLVLIASSAGVAEDRPGSEQRANQIRQNTDETRLS